MITIPYDDGWEITVNGKKVKPIKMQDIFVGIEVPAGHNAIVMKYVLPGFKYGCICSLFGIAIFAFNNILFGNKKRIKRTKLE